MKPLIIALAFLLGFLFGQVTELVSVATAVTVHCGIKNQP